MIFGSKYITTVSFNSVFWTAYKVLEAVALMLAQQIKPQGNGNFNLFTTPRVKRQFLEVF
jgi:hypothetical protein